MPIKKYFKGHGEEVMDAMKKEYGEKEGKSVFYAKANAMKSKKKGKFPTNKKQVGGSNPFFGNSLPFQLGEGGRWVDDSRKMGPMSMKGKGK